MIVLSAAAILLVLLALSFVLPPLLRDGDNARDNKPSVDDANASVYRAQLAEMQEELSDGSVTHEQFARNRAEVELRLAGDLTRSVPNSRVTEPAMKSGTLAYVLVVAIPVLALLMYLALGSSATHGLP